MARSVWVVGGAVRNVLLGLPVNDIDYVVVGATVEEMVAEGYQQVGADFPVFLKNGCEYALARTERKTGIGYHGFTANASPQVTLEEDLMRRDLTINAMAVHVDEWGFFQELVAGEDDYAKRNWLPTILIDPYGGQVDLKQGLVRPVALDTFVEDPLRVLRAARFAAIYDMAWSPEMEKAAHVVVKSGELATVSKERFAAEIDKVLDQCKTAGAVSRFTFRLHQFGVIDDAHYSSRSADSLATRAELSAWFDERKSLGAKLIALCDDAMVQVFAERFGFSNQMVDMLNFSHLALETANVLACDFDHFHYGRDSAKMLLELHEDISKGKSALTVEHLQEMVGDYPQMGRCLEWLKAAAQVHKENNFATVVVPIKDTLQPSQYGTEIYCARVATLRRLIDAEVEKGA